MTLARDRRSCLPFSGDRDTVAARHVMDSKRTFPRGRRVVVFTEHKAGSAQRAAPVHRTITGLFGYPIRSKTGLDLSEPIDYNDQVVSGRLIIL